MTLFLRYLLVFNAFLIIFMAIYEIKNIKSFLFWFFIIIFFPIIGFVVYVVFGNALKFNSKGKLIEKENSTKNFVDDLKIAKLNKIEPPNDTFRFVKQNFNAPIWNFNKISTFLCGETFLKDLIKEIKQAKCSINMEFYIFSDDATGKEVAKELIKKAQNGVEVNVVYDSFGCKNNNKKFWKKMKQAGINVIPFFPSPFKIEPFNFKINYRNHRKIVVIDAKIAYVGGINLRNDHMNKSKLKPWRDTQIKIEGNAVFALQNVFLNDFLFASNKTINEIDIEKYFQTSKTNGNVSLQILESGPEKSKKQIYETYLKMISTSKNHIFIESPYFIVDNNIILEIKKALKRNVKVTIIVPQKPDKKIVYGATLLCLSKLVDCGADVFFYHNFIHSKVFVCDNTACIGTCNFDNRSFFLNFEIACLCYDSQFVSQQIKNIKNDIKNSIMLSKKQFNKLKTKNLFAIVVYKIVSKLL